MKWELTGPLDVGLKVDHCIGQQVVLVLALTVACIKSRPSAPVSTTSCALGKECEAQCGGGRVKKSGSSGKFTLGYSEVTTTLARDSGKPNAMKL